MLIIRAIPIIIRETVHLPYLMLSSPPTQKNHAKVKGVPTLKDMTPKGTWVHPIGNNPKIVMGAS
jgi:hypothetical protein